MTRGIDVGNCPDAVEGGLNFGAFRCRSNAIRVVDRAKQVAEDFLGELQLEHQRFVALDKGQRRHGDIAEQQAFRADQDFARVDAGKDRPAFVVGKMSGYLGLGQAAAKDVQTGDVRLNFDGANHGLALSIAQPHVNLALGPLVNFDKVGTGFGYFGVGDAEVRWVDDGKFATHAEIRVVFTPEITIAIGGRKMDTIEGGVALDGHIGDGLTLGVEDPTGDNRGLVKGDFDAHSFGVISGQADTGDTVVIRVLMGRDGRFPVQGHAAEVEAAVTARDHRLVGSADRRACQGDALEIDGDTADRAALEVDLVKNMILSGHFLVGDQGQVMEGPTQEGMVDDQPVVA